MVTIDVIAPHYHQSRNLHQHVTLITAISSIAQPLACVWIMDLGRDLARDN